jgi:hypothetical protein
MANEDWRFRVELEQGDRIPFLERLRGGLGEEGAEIAKALEGEHVVVSEDGGEVYVYAGTRAQARHAHAIVESELRRHGVEAEVSRVEHWLEDEERWDGEPEEETWEEETVERGWAPWEVRADCGSRAEAGRIADLLADEGFRPVRRWRYLIVGAESREDAEALAKRLHGEVEPGGEVVWEEASYTYVMTPFRTF